MNSVRSDSEKGGGFLSDSKTRRARTARRTFPWTPPIAIACAVLLYLVIAPAADTSTVAASFEFADINPRSETFGRTVSLGDLYEKRGVVLRFMASWCEVCRDELPELRELRASSNAPIVFMAADEDGAPDSLLIVAERNGLTAPILFVPEDSVEEVERQFPHQILPATYLIDRGGKIRMSHEGAMTRSRLVRDMETQLGI